VIALTQHCVRFMGEDFATVSQLQSYARYYNEIRTHRSLNDDAPLTRPVQRSGHIVSHAMVGGLHHQYVRI